jgi:hypothetical protein
MINIDECLKCYSEIVEKLDELDNIISEQRNIYVEKLRPIGLIIKKSSNCMIQ